MRHTRSRGVFTAVTVFCLVASSFGAGCRPAERAPPTVREPTDGGGSDDDTPNPPDPSSPDAGAADSRSTQWLIFTASFTR